VHVLVISQYFWPEDFRINELVSAFCGRGHDVTVLTGKPNYPEGSVFPEFMEHPEKFAEYAGARIIRVPMFARGAGSLRILLNYSSFAVSSCFFATKALGDRPIDAIFVFEPSPVTVGLPAVWLRCRCGAPIVFWVLDQWPESLEAVGVVTSKRLLSYVGALVKFIYRRCDLVLSPSRSLMPRIAEYCAANQRIEYFPNWIESTYRSVSAEPAHEVPPKPGSFSVMFAGNIGEAQDFPSILDAAERLKHRDDIRWLIVGDGRMAPWVRAEIARRGLTGRVLMLGRFPVERMPSFFHHADALLVSLKADPVFAMTAPGKIQSYLAYGRPILAMLDGEGARIIRDARAGFTSPAGDSAGLAVNAARLADMPAEERASMGVNGVAFAKKEFDREVLFDRLESWLFEVADSSAVAASR